MTKNRSKKHRIFSIFTSLAILAISSFIFMRFTTQSAHAVWFDDTYSYRLKFSFVHNADISGDRSVTFSLDTAELIAANLMLSNCNDTRFTDGNGKPLLYDLTGTCNNAATTYEVIFPSIVNGTNVGYVYYGNPGASNAEINSSGYTTLTPSGGDPSNTTPTTTDEQGVSPISYWNFDEGQGSTANDYSAGNNNDLTITNALWKTSDVCATGNCLYFDGNADYATKAYSSDTELLPATNSFSVTAWFKHNSTAGADTLISRADGVNGVGWKVYMNSSGFMCFGIDQTAGSFPLNSACTPLSYADSTWHFVTAVKSGTTSITIYIDGAQITQTTGITASSISGTNAPITIGNDFDNGTNGWVGFIDEVKYYNFAKSISQIQTEYASKSSTHGVSASLGSSTSNLGSGLMGYWKLDESSGNATDSSGNALTLTNNGTTTFVGSKYGNGSSHNGTTQYFSTVTAISNIQTVAFWVNPASTSDDYIHLINSSTYINSSSGTVSATGFTSPSIYVNGILNGTLTASVWNHVVVTTTTAVNATAFEVGRANGAYLNNTGKMDEIRIYNRALSPAEVSALYSFAPGPVGWWKLDENTGTSVTDATGNGSAGSFVNSPKWLPGKIGSSLYFNGNTSDSAINLGDNNALDFSDTNSISVDFWINLAGLASFNNPSTIISKQNGTSAGMTFFLGSSTTCQISDTVPNQICMKISDGTDIYFIYASASSMALNNWYHVAGVIDRNNSANNLIYINGIAQTTTTSGTLANVGSLANTNVACLGIFGAGANCNTTQELYGYLDDLRVYNYARTSKQIIEDMNGGHPAGGSPVGSYVSRWSFNDMQGTNVNDLTDNNNDLTLSSASWTTSGKYSGAWNGTGSIWASRADDADFDFAASTDFSLSMWVKSDSATNPVTNDEVIIQKKAAGNVAGYRMYFANSTGLLTCDLDDDTTSYPEDTATTTTDYYDATWHHVVCIRDIASGKLNLYVDGKLAGQDTSLSATGSLENATALYIGDDDGDATNSFAGDIDEVKIYRSALSPSEVLLDMNANSSITLGGVDDHTDKGFSLPAAVAQWKMDENTPNTCSGGANDVCDTSSGGIDGAFSGNTAFTQGEIGSAVTFDGTSDYVSFGDNINIADGDSFSISVWIYPTANTQDAQIVSKKDSIWTASETGYDISWWYNTDGGNTCFYLSDGTAGGSDQYEVCTPDHSTDTLNQWYHIVGVFDNSTLAGSAIYLNGVEYNTYESCTNCASPTEIGSLSNTLGLCIGTDAQASGGCGTANEFTGKIDDVRIFRSALTKAQVEYLYNQGAPIAWYKFDECSGATAYNAALNSQGQAAGMNGTITPGDTTGDNDTVGSCSSGTTTEMWNDGTTGKYNSSLGFDGTNDQVSVATDANFNLTTNFTISAWIYPTSWGGGFPTIVSRDSGTAGYTFYIRQTNASLSLCVNGASCNYGLDNRISLNSWQHVVWVNNAGTNTLYVNGNTAGAPAGSPSSLTTRSFYIGSADGASDFFTGQIDNVQIYNYPQSSSQVKRLYNEGSAVRFGPATGSP